MKTKVKIFTFSASKNCFDGKEHFLIGFDSEEAENQINEFLSNPDINFVDLKVEIVKPLRNTNGGFDNNIIIYTLVYNVLC